MFLIDTHCHIDDEQFLDKKEIIENFVSCGGEIAINMGCDEKSSKTGLELAKEYLNVYCGVGVHPENVNKTNSETLKNIETLAKSEKCVAIGEIGLDYHFEPFDKDKQIEVFVSQIDIANKLKLPISIHSRDATLDMVNILKENRDKLSHGAVMHCFSGSRETAKVLLDLGLYIGFGGTVTFKNSVKTVEVASYVPLDRMLTETDSPYLAPSPLRGTRNEPKNVGLVIEFLSTLRGKDREEFSQIIKDNTLRLFTKIKK
ncbi:MAG: TatD family hydrolase [Firmicutes bacterium]|nr:TatD family hydrolase [Candidatus Caballimonas caccae]